jgi:hypothetical protein
VGSLTGALRDQARVVRPLKLGPRVEGRSYLSPIHGDWFPARLILSPAREVEDEHHGRRRIVESGEVVCATDDVQGTDELEVKSRTLGLTRWHVAGSPQVARTRRPGVAVVVPVERLVEPQAAEAIG